MSSDAPEYSQQDLSDLLYTAILSVWARMISCDTECRAFDRKRANSEVFYCALLIVSILLWLIVLQWFFSTLEGMMFINKNREDKVYVIMGFIVLFTSSPTIYSNKGASSELGK